MTKEELQKGEEMLEHLKSVASCIESTEEWIDDAQTFLDAFKLGGIVPKSAKLGIDANYPSGYKYVSIPITKEGMTLAIEESIKVWKQRLERYKKELSESNLFNIPDEPIKQEKEKSTKKIKFNLDSIGFSFANLKK